MARWSWWRPSFPGAASLELGAVEVEVGGRGVASAPGAEVVGGSSATATMLPSGLTASSADDTTITAVGRVSRPCGAALVVCPPTCPCPGSRPLRPPVLVATSASTTGSRAHGQASRPRTASRQSTWSRPGRRASGDRPFRRSCPRWRSPSAADRGRERQRGAAGRRGAGMGQSSRRRRTAGRHGRPQEPTIAPKAALAGPGLPSPGAREHRRGLAIGGLLQHLDARPREGRDERIWPRRGERSANRPGPPRVRDRRARTGVGCSPLISSGTGWPSWVRTFAPEHRELLAVARPAAGADRRLAPRPPRRVPRPRRLPGVPRVDRLPRAGRASRSRSTPTGVDAEIADVAGPQLVVPVDERPLRASTPPTPGGARSTTRSTAPTPCGDLPRAGGPTTRPAAPGSSPGCAPSSTTSCRSRTARHADVTRYRVDGGAAGRAELADGDRARPRRRRPASPGYRGAPDDPSRAARAPRPAASSSLIDRAHPVGRGRRRRRRRRRARVGGHDDHRLRGLRRHRRRRRTRSAPTATGSA